MSGIRIIIVGDRLTLSNQIEIIAKTSLNATEVIWTDSLETVPVDLPAKLTLVEQDALTDMDEAHVAALDRLPSERTALAYRDTDVAIDFLDRVQRLERPQRFGIIPLNIQYDGWVALLRLLVMGQLFAPLSILRDRPRPPEPASRIDLDLTHREMQILELAAIGKQNKIIAADLDLSEHTVRLYMHRILAKLGVKNRTEAAGVYFSRNDPAHSPA